MYIIVKQTFKIVLVYMMTNIFKVDFEKIYPFL